MEWSDEQKKAIFRGDTNIIVSAGAGSGKTAVLSERVLKFVIKGGDITKLLVLTFTKAAAAEMKDRIRKKLKKYSDPNFNEEDVFSEDGEKRKLTDIERERCKKGAMDIDYAYITTFDAYSLAIVKKYYYALDLKKNVTMINNIIENYKLNEITNTVFDDLYDENNPMFLSILKKYTTQDDEDIKGIVSTIYKSMNLTIDVEEFYNTYEDKYFNDLSKQEEIKKGFMNLLKLDIKKLFDLFDDYLREIDISKNEKIVKYLAELKENLEASTNFEELKKVLEDVKIPSIAPKTGSDEASDIRKCISETIKYINKSYFIYSNLDEVIESTLKNKDEILFLLKMAKDIYDKFYDYKFKNMTFSFSDIARMAIRLVKENESIRNELRDYFDEILVDEYQDTSDIQETFLKMISYKNLYMVGDIKQSIYQFRNANPYIFKDKYDRYSKDDDGFKIDLKDNFRSRAQVIENINKAFEVIMTDDCGDADYKSSHIMNYGQKAYEKLNQGFDYNLEMLSYTKTDDYKNFTKEEIEAFIIASKIEEIYNSKIKVLKKDEFEEITYGDFAIIIDKAVSFTTFKRIFDYKNIPLIIEGQRNLKDSELITVFSNVLTLISKTKNHLLDTEYYHKLASLARGFVYEYSDEDVYRIVKNKECEGINLDISSLSMLEDISYEDLYYEICDTLNIYNKLSVIGNVDENIVVLNEIHGLFKSFNDMSLSLDEAAKILASAVDGNNEIKYDFKSNVSDGVRIMTIHHSKGLEFPFLFMPLLSTGFNETDIKSANGFSKKYGIYMPSIEDGDKNDSVIKILNKYEEEKALVSEKVRLLYVAYTRAREKIYLIKEDKVDIEEKNVEDNKFKRFSEMIFKTNAMDKKVLINLDTINITDEYKKSKYNPYLSKGKKLVYEDREEIETVEQTHASMNLKELPTKETLDVLELGTMCHKALEVLDLKNPDIDSLPIDNNIKTKIKAILSNDIFKNIKNGKDYHEFEFYQDIDGSVVHSIIDLFVVYSDHIDIIDYKLSNTAKEEYEKQLNTYKNYLSTIYDLPIKVYLVSILRNEIKEL